MYVWQGKAAIRIFFPSTQARRIIWVMFSSDFGICNCIIEFTFLTIKVNVACTKIVYYYYFFVVIFILLLRIRDMMGARVLILSPPCLHWGEPSPWTEGPLSPSWRWEISFSLSFVKQPNQGQGVDALHLLTPFIHMILWRK